MSTSSKERRRIGVVSVGRSDFSIYLPILQAARAYPRLEICLIASGAHLRPEHGMTVSAIRAAGFEPGALIDFMDATETAQGVTDSLAKGIELFGKHFNGTRYDCIMILGDRFEMLCPALAALPFRIPVAHIHGGEETVGAFDNQIRHALTKLSHLHFVSADAYRDRVVAMGESPRAAIVSGAPALDGLSTFSPLDAKEVCRRLDLDTLDNVTLFTYHHETLGSATADEEAAVLTTVLSEGSTPVVITAPNPDPGGMILRRAFERLAKPGSPVRFRENLGFELFFSLLSHSAVMAGNSSSGIIEAPSLKVPVVNIGGRQAGRIRAANVIDCPLDADALRKALARARSKDFKDSLRGLENPYWNGGASKIILGTLSEVPLDDSLLRKAFHDGGMHA